jgi:outer membrane protein assembly factor BamB
MSIRILVLIGIVLIWSAEIGRAEDWPQFRGPGGTGIVTGKVLPPDRWSTTENLGWKVAIP